MATAWAGCPLKPAGSPQLTDPCTYTHTHAGFLLFIFTLEDQIICLRPQRGADGEHTPGSGWRAQMGISPRHMLDQNLPEGTQAQLTFIY